jgi:antitoxin component of RelBE/YafQ-DinJ toxin-antitoxin module
MELKTARLTLLIDPNKKAAFEHLCSQLDLTPSQVVRQLIRDFLAQHGMPYTPSGQDLQDARAAGAGRGGAARATKATKATRSR